MGLAGRQITLPVIAADASADKILPRVLSTSCPRHNMIDRQRNIAPATVLTFVPVTPQNVLS